MTPTEFLAEIQSRGWNATSAADFFGVYRSTVSRWIHGQRRIPGAVCLALQFSRTKDAQPRQKKAAKTIKK